MNEDELAFVYEKNLKALPTFALVQGYSPYWLRNPDSGVELDQGRARRAGLHAAQAGQDRKARSSAAPASSR